MGTKIFRIIPTKCYGDVGNPQKSIFKETWLNSLFSWEVASPHFPLTTWLRKWNEDSIKCLKITIFFVNFVKENENLGNGMFPCNLIRASKSPFSWGNLVEEVDWGNLIKYLSFQKSWIFLFLERTFLLEEVVYITNLESHDLVMKIMKNSFIHNSYISHVDIVHWKHIFHIDL